MSDGKKRTVHSAEFKAKVGMEAVRGVKTLNEIGQQYGVHPVVVGQWKKELIERAATVERLWRSVKYEEVYLKGYGTVTELTLGLVEYFAFYNGERPHQSLDNRTPNTVYADGQGGGARIPDHVGVRTGQRCSAAIETMGVA
ncbi:MAG: hypothetical protein E8D48_13390 [Nitrospira sp.]|nr:MAG: hypothetical protein E8D48_13390 [Nitrospira sp.]